MARQATARAITPPPEEAPPQRLEINLQPAPDASKALALREQARALVVQDRDSHAAALEFLRGVKALKRTIEEHWSRITRGVDDLKRNMLTLKARDLEAVEDAVKYANDTILTYETSEKRRAQEEQDRLRRQSEEQARKDREAELARLEREALKAEQTSENLSEREQAFVDAYIHGIGAAGLPEVAAKRAGYKDAAAQAERLMKTSKILKAIEAKRRAIEIREQAASVAEKPLEVKTQDVRPQFGKVAGTRTVTTWKAECFDVDALIDAVLRGVAPRSLLMFNQVAGNELARSIHEEVDRIPGLRHIKTETKAG